MQRHGDVYHVVRAKTSLKLNQYYFFLLVWMAFFCFPFAFPFCYGANKPNIAVSLFIDTTGKAQNHINLVDKTLVKYLYRTKRFNIVDRGNLDKVLLEKELVLSGVTTADDTKAIAEILAIDYFVVGDIVRNEIVEGNLEIDMKLVRMPLARDKETGNVISWEYNLVSTTNIEYSIKVQISGKLINASTGEVSYIKTGNASLSENYDYQLSSAEISSIQGELFEAATKNFITKLMSDIKLRGTILKVSGKTVLINLGKENGLFKRSNLKVFTTERIKNNNGNDIIRRNSVATLIVRHLRDDYSEAEVFSGDIAFIEKGQSVEVIAPEARVIDAIPSVIVPGLSQVLNRKYVSSISYFATTAFFVGLGVPMLLGNFDKLLTPNTLLDTVITKSGKTYDANGKEVSKLDGRIASTVAIAIDVTAWIFIGVGTIVYIANVIDATFPAEFNPAFVQNNHNVPANITPHFYSTLRKDNSVSYHVELQVGF